MLITEDKSKKVYKKCSSFPSCDNNELLQNKGNEFHLSGGVSIE